MNRNRIEIAEKTVDGRHILNELYVVRSAGKKEYQWLQTIDGVERVMFHFISEKNMRNKMKEWDFHFQK